MFVVRAYLSPHFAAWKGIDVSSRADEVTVEFTEPNSADVRR